ncbi:MAG: CoA-binding protein [Anaerolineae bacterium]|nr:CoA-binding protein [Anaerolineae bacterium]
MALNDPAAMDHLFATAKIIAIVGLSSDEERPSHGVAAYLQRQGYRIIPVNPYEREVLGERAYRDLQSVPERVDIVNIFRRPTAVLPHVEEAIAMGAPAVWMQLGVVNQRAVERALAAGLAVVQDRCIAVEHNRWRARREMSRQVTA